MQLIKINKPNRRPIRKANRGRAFEEILDYTNKIYERKGIALINKRPTPIKVITQRGKFINKAVFDKPSTVDYDGIYQGQAVAFEAKESMGKSFPLSNLTTGQIRYLRAAYEHGAISFLLVNMVEEKKTFFIHYETLESYVYNASIGGRKSIPVKEMLEICVQVESRNGLPVDYITAIKDDLKVRSGEYP